MIASEDVLPLVHKMSALDKPILCSFYTVWWTVEWRIQCKAIS